MAEDVPQQSKEARIVEDVRGYHPGSRRNLDLFDFDRFHGMEHAQGESEVPLRM